MIVDRHLMRVEVTRVIASRHLERSDPVNSATPMPVGRSIRSILAAIDDSGHAPLVLRTAASLARDLKARLVLVRVLLVPPEIPAGGPPQYARSSGRETRHR